MSELRGDYMIQVFKDYREMINHIRGNEVEIKHKAVKVEEIKKPKKKTSKKKKEDK